MQRMQACHSWGLSLCSRSSPMAGTFPFDSFVTKEQSAPSLTCTAARRNRLYSKIAGVAFPPCSVAQTSPVWWSRPTGRSPFASAAIPQPDFNDSSDEEQPDAFSAIEANIGFIGAGNMGGAMLRGWLDSGIVTQSRCGASVASTMSRAAWSNLGLHVFGDVNSTGASAADIARFSDVIFVGVKPLYLGGVLSSLAPHITKKHTVVSIAAGWTIKQLEAQLPEGTSVIRVMPNTPILVGQGSSGYCLGTHAAEEDREMVHALLDSCGMALEVEEHMMDALTGVSGSGPAYMFMILEAMADGGVSMGLPRDKALALAAQTMKGAAEMVLSSSEKGLTHPGVLKDQVTSPNGTTIAAVASLENNSIRRTMIQGVQAAAKRSRELGAANSDA